MCGQAYKVEKTILQIYNDQEINWMIQEVRK